jgi:hypothetical protein
MSKFYPSDSWKPSVKETIIVDKDSRHSSQNIILCNPNNHFYGKFSGSADLSDVTIKNGKIEDSNGNEINLENLVSSTSELIEFKKYISVDFDNKIDDTNVNLSSYIRSVSCALDGKIDDIDIKFSDYVEELSGNIDGISSYISGELNEKIEQIDGNIENNTT